MCTSVRLWTAWFLFRISKMCVPFGQRVKCLFTHIARALLVLGSYIVTQPCPVIYLLFNCAPWNPICDQQVALDVSQLWLEWRVDWFASGLALMFCYCYLHNAVQPLTAGLLLFLFSNVPAFLQSYIWFLFDDYFSPESPVFNIPPFNFKTTEFSLKSILTARFKHRWICVNPWLHFIL